MLDFLILIVDNLGKFWVFIAYFANTSVVGYFFGLICQSPPLFEMKRLEFLCTIQLKETTKVFFFPYPGTYGEIYKYMYIYVHTHTYVYGCWYIRIYIFIYTHIHGDRENALSIWTMTKFSAELRPVLIALVSLLVNCILKCLFWWLLMLVCWALAWLDG